MIIGINKADSADSAGSHDDFKTSSVNNLSLNDLSSSVTTVSLIKRMIRSPGDIFERLPSDRFGPKGTTVATCMHIAKSSSVAF